MTNITHFIPRNPHWAARDRVMHGLLAPSRVG